MNRTQETGDPIYSKIEFDNYYCDIYLAPNIKTEKLDCLKIFMRFSPFVWENYPVYLIWA